MALFTDRADPAASSPPISTPVATALTCWCWACRAVACRSPMGAIASGGARVLNRRVVEAYDVSEEAVQRVADDDEVPRLLKEAGGDED